MSNEAVAQQLVSNVADQAGVSVEEASKVLKTLGIDGLVANIRDVGADSSKVALGEVKLAVRLGRSGVVV